MRKLPTIWELPEVVTRMLRYFQNENILSLSRGTIEILDRKRLLAMAE